MALTLRWVDSQDHDRVAEARLYSYAGGMKDATRFREVVELDASGDGDFLLAERDGRPVGTSTGMPMTMWVRGGGVSCQGVRYVGAIKTERRKRPAARDEPGVATAVMRATVRRARERGCVVSALMPFRASFYEHFGYGLVERLHEWTVPLAILPPGEFDGVRFMRPEDAEPMADCRSRIAKAGQCDIERLPHVWKMLFDRKEETFFVVDRPADEGSVHGWAAFSNHRENGKDFIRIGDLGYDSLGAFRRLLHFLASLRDQYTGAVLLLPSDLPLNWLLRETQVPHRPVNHPTPQLSVITRMQVRIIDHRRFLEALHLHPEAKGSAVIAVRECEGDLARFRIDIEGGTIGVKPSDASANFECPDKVWAAVACGDLPAGEALRWGLATGSESAGVLNWLAEGPKPFCAESF